MLVSIKKYMLYVGLIILSISCLGPFLLMIINATRSGREIMTSFTLIPGNQLAKNWEIMTGYFNIFQGIWNSLLVAICCTMLTAYFSAITAYSLATYKFRGNKLIFTCILIFMMIPSQLGLLGFYDLINGMRLVDSYIPLIIPTIASPATVFFLRQYTKAVLPKALLEAARIDGASEILIYHKIVLPIMAPGVATISIGTFIGSWNNYLMPLILLFSPKKFTLPVMMASMRASQDITSNQGAIYLTVAISVIPIMAAFCFFSKYIISGISAGGIKE